MYQIYLKLNTRITRRDYKAESDIESDVVLPPDGFDSGVQVT